MADIDETLKKFGANLKQTVDSMFYRDYLPIDGVVE